jgi:hypothetical protein
MSDLISYSSAMKSMISWIAILCKLKFMYLPLRLLDSFQATGHYNHIIPYNAAAAAVVVVTKIKTNSVA